jgi:hypothetical protein
MSLIQFFILAGEKYDTRPEILILLVLRKPISNWIALSDVHPWHIIRGSVADQQIDAWLLPFRAAL